MFGQPVFVRRRVRRHAALGLTYRKHHEMQELARRWLAAREIYVADYWSERYVQFVLHRPRDLVQERRRSGWARDDLSTNFNKTAMESALGAVRGNWRATLASVSELIRQNSTIAATERRWLQYVLASPNLLQSCLTGTAETNREWAAEVDEARLSHKLRRLVLRYRLRRPRPQRRLWLEVDTNLYRTFMRSEDRFYRGAWIAVSGLERGHRVAIPLAGDNLEYLLPRPGVRGRPNLRIDVDSRITFETVERAPIQRSAGTVRAGVDKGFRDLLTLSTGAPEDADRFGVNANEQIGRIADAAAERQRQRRRLAAYERSIRSTDGVTARRIRRRCLGRRKTIERDRVEKARLREQIDAGLNELFTRRRDIRSIAVEDLRFTSARRLSRSLNRRLSRWMKGVLQRRLAFKADLNSVELIVVNAAYASQTCTHCGFTHPRNRDGERFECRSCGYTGSADAVAATNVLRRGSDPAITCFTVKDDVKRILDARWRSALIGSARGSNAGLPRRAIATSTSDEPRRTGGLATGPKVM